MFAGTPFVADTCSDGIDAASDTNIAAYLTSGSNGLGMKNPYAQDEAAGTFAKAVANATTDPDDDGRITVHCAAGGACTIKQRVVDGTVLSQTINSAS